VLGETSAASRVTQSDIEGEPAPPVLSAAAIAANQNSFLPEVRDGMFDDDKVMCDAVRCVIVAGE
jgi:hypothetical protein